MGTGTVDLVIAVPVLRRPHRVVPFVASLEANTPDPHRTIFVGTAGDDEMIAECRRFADTLESVSVEIMRPTNRGDYAKKINHAVRSSSEPFILAAADDLRFHRGWWPAARARFDDPTIGVVGTQDLCNPRTIAGDHSTHLIFRRAYVDELGTIDRPGLAFCEEYPHEYVDDEAVETAKFRGAWAFADDSIVEHLHPSVGKAQIDGLYAAQGERMIAGNRIIRRRRPLWTPPPPRPTPSTTSIVIGTFGAESWATLARDRAQPSAVRAGALEVILSHRDTLAEARNAGAARARGEWLCFLDADDELEPGYLEAMAATASGDLLAPAVRYVEDLRAIPNPVTLEDRDIRRLNPCVIGTLLRRSMFHAAGGFWEERAFEDWSLFRRCFIIGAEIRHVPEAVYRVHVSTDSRNSTVHNSAGLMQQIRQSHSVWRRRQRTRLR